VVDDAARVEDELAVGAHIGDAVSDPVREVPVVVHGPLGVPDDLLEAADTVGHVRVAEYRPAKQLAQPRRMELPGKLEELQQVDDLVVAPVADVAPGIAGILDFPVDSFLGDAIGVVSVDGRGVHELGDGALYELGEAQCQRLPVLEDVAPVALVEQGTGAGLVRHPDGKTVPWPAGVAVTPAEGDGQVLVAQPLELGVARAPHDREQVLH
jgi:hypothetical protein